MYFIAVWAVIIGAFEVIASIEGRDLVKGAGWLTASGVISIVFGAVVAVRPGTGALAILWLIGVYAIVAGATRLYAASRMRGAEDKIKQASQAMQPQS